MKFKITGFIILLTIVCLSLFCVNEVSASELTAGSDEISSQVNEMLEDYGVSYTYEDMESLSLSGIIESVKESLDMRLKAPFRLLGTIIMVIIFSSFMKSAGETALTGGTAVSINNLVCVIAAVTVITPSLLTLYENSARAIEAGAGFMLAFVPVFVAVSIMSGGVFSAGVYNTITLAAAEMMVQAVRSILMPLLAMNAALSITGSVFPKATLDSIVNLIKKVITWGLTVSVTLFTGFVSLRTTLGGAADSFTSKTAKFVISGFVPVIGSAVSDAYTTVKGSFGVMKCTAGTAGTVAIVLLLLPPVLEVMAFRLVMWIGAASAEMFSVKPVEKLLKSLDSGLAIILSVLVCFAMLFIISTAILMKSFT